MSRNPYLPMTEDDIVRRLLHQKTKKLMKKRKKLGRLGRLPLWLLISVTLTLLGGTAHLFVRLRRSKIGQTTVHLAPRKIPVAREGSHKSKQKLSSSRRTLLQFPSLEYALSHSKLVALYFAASWCPMSTPVSLLLDEQINEMLVPPAEVEERHGSLSLVYVSSDQSDAEMKEYLANRPSWMFVPYESPERGLLKKHFKTCAKVEMNELQLKRKHEIPTLIVIDSESQQVLTFTGVKDVQEEGAKAVDTWFHLARLSAALDAKFVHTDDTGVIE